MHMNGRDNQFVVYNMTRFKNINSVGNIGVEVEIKNMDDGGKSGQRQIAL